MPLVVQTSHVICVVLGILYFAAISIATKTHFQSSRFATGMRVAALLSLAGIANFLVALGRNSWGPIAAIPLIIVAGLVFASALWTSRSGNLGLAFDPTARSVDVLQTGPFRRLRHPFYASYILFWIAAAIYSWNLFGAAVSAALTVGYVMAARQEEARLLSSAVGPDYAAYKQRAGFLWPRI